MLEKWSFRYWLLKQYVKLAYWLFHREIVVSGRENIPRGQPVIFASNHPNALSDILSLVCAAPQQVVWMGRASLFKARWAIPFLRFLKIIPVYRIRDGKDTLKGNEASFETALGILKQNGALGLYPEAAHSGKRVMLAHKKAIPRMVFLAGEKSGDTMNIQIVPVGIHYDQYFHFGRRLLISFGKPLPSAGYYPLYRQNPHQATLRLRDDIYNAILPLVLNYQSDTHYEGFEAVREIAGKSFARAQGLAGTLRGQLHADQALAARLDSLAADHPREATQLAGKATQLRLDFRNLKLRSWLCDHSEENKSKAWLSTLLLLATFPFFLQGWVFNIIPFAGLGKGIKGRIKDPVWFSTFTFGLGIVVFPLFYLLILLVAVSSFLPWPYAMLFVISLPFAGKLAFSWYVTLLKTRGRWRWLQIKRRNRALYENLHQRKAEIISEITALSEPGITTRGV